MPQPRLQQVCKELRANRSSALKLRHSNASNMQICSAAAAPFQDICPKEQSSCCRSFDSFSTQNLLFIYIHTLKGGLMGLQSWARMFQSMQDKSELAGWELRQFLGGDITARCCILLGEAQDH